MATAAAIKKIMVAEDGKKFYVRSLSEDFHTQYGFIEIGRAHV